LSTETKSAFKTTEFWAMVAVVVAILVSAQSISGSETAPGTDSFVAKQAWLALVYAVRKFRERSDPPSAQTALGRGNVDAEVHFLPGCLIFSLLASVILTILLNLIVRAF
jgi:hypothetical protein